MVRARSRPWGQFIPCRFRWFHKRRQIPLTSVQTFNLKKKKVSKGREAPGDVSRGECWQTQNTRKINHRASLRLDLFKIFAPHSGELFSLTPHLDATSFRHEGASQLSDLGRGGLGCLVGNTQALGECRWVPTSNYHVGPQRPRDLKLIREICSRR